jgi:two-component system cell cycle response regulator
MSAAPHSLPMKVLIAEDNPIDMKLLHSTLAGWGYKVVDVTDGAAAWHALQDDNSPRLAILDWLMPGKSGVDVCRALRNREARPYVYLLILTSKTKKEEMIQAFDAGADDCISKPFLAGELRARLRVGERILALQDNLLATQEKLRHDATHDQLTGLWNHTAILKMLHRELARSGRTAVPLGAVMADLDQFKHINDTHGHAAGDAVLCEVARRMTETTRVYDFVGRYGGEEFLILLPGCNSIQAARMAERLRLAVAAGPVETRECEIGVTLSLGVAVTEGMRLPEAKALLLEADTALYLAKANGRNQVEVAGSHCSSAASVPS